MMDVRAVSVMFSLTMSWCVVRGQPTYVSPSKNHCFYCPAGTQVQEHCKEDLTNSTCTDCPRHYYRDKGNDKTHCHKCKSHCVKLSHQVSNCTKKTDMDCECNEGHHRFPLDSIDDSWKCKPHKECGDGEGEVYTGNHTHNTLCQKCKQGQHFVNMSNPAHPVCQDCRRCGSGQFVRKACTLHTDTLCGQDGGRSIVSSPTPPAAASTTVDTAGGGGGGGGGDSDVQLSIGHIGLIVCAAWVVFGILVAVPLKKCLRPSESLCTLKLCLWFFVAASVIGIVVSICMARSSDNAGNNGRGGSSGPSDIPLVVRTTVGSSESAGNVGRDSSNGPSDALLNRQTTEDQVSEV